MPRNQLLAALPEEEYQRLSPHLEPVSLSLGQVLYETREPIRSVYFPTQALVSLVSTVENDLATEVGLVGIEGMVGIPVILGGNFAINRAIVQIPDGAMRMNADVLATEFKRGGMLQRLLLLYLQAFITQISQTGVCKSHHTLEKRLARWLLTIRDCIQKDELRITQKYIAKLLGVQRPSVTIAANTLSKAKTIRYSRGKISILNQELLESSACECYGLVKAEFIRLLNVERR